MAFAPFQALYTFFDASVVQVVQNGTARMIALISPLLAAGFGIYLMLILSSYWRGDTDEPVTDFFFRMIGWGAIIVFGLNISVYTQYIIPFVNGAGDDLASVVGQNGNSAVALDAMANGFLDAFIKLYSNASGIEETLFVLLAIVGVSLFAGAFMVIAIAYVILAKLALGLLLAIGPLFIASALFPATRDLFKNWTGQILNYVFLVMLFSFIAQIEIQFVSNLIPTNLDFESLGLIILSCALLIFVSLNLPGLASALAGGVGISTLVRKLPGIPKLPKLGGGGSDKGGEIKGS